MTGLEKAIIKTLCYADVFDYPLTAAEIHQYLIHTSTAKLASVNQTLANLQKTRRISTRQGYYYLKDRQDIVGLRLRRKRYAAKKLKQARNITHVLKYIPTISGVFVTGALAMQNTDKNDDIDVMIITKPHTLWLTRLEVALLLRLMRAHRKPGKIHAPNTFCTNLFLDETTIGVPSPKKNLYTAHEISQVKPLVNRHQIYEKFLAANGWATKFLPHTQIPNIDKFKPRHPSIITRTLNKLLFKLQFNYMRRRMTREVVTPHTAFFHPRDTKNLILKTYEDRLAKYLS